jgi:prophage maintenance system killer protein
MKGDEKKILKKHILKSDLPTVEMLKQINLKFLNNAKQGKKDSCGVETVYHLYHFESYSKTRKHIVGLPQNKVEIIESMIKHFPEKTSIYEQCAYYYRAFSRAQIFPDANHRTGFFSLQYLVRLQGLYIDSDNEEIVGLTEYIRGQGWLKMGDITVRLTEKDDQYKYLVSWFKEKLKLG